MLSLSVGSQWHWHRRVQDRPDLNEISPPASSRIGAPVFGRQPPLVIQWYTTVSAPAAAACHKTLLRCPAPHAAGCCCTLRPCLDEFKAQMLRSTPNPRHGRRRALTAEGGAVASACFQDFRRHGRIMDKPALRGRPACGHAHWTGRRADNSGNWERTSNVPGTHS